MMIRKLTAVFCMTLLLVCTVRADSGRDPDVSPLELVRLTSTRMLTALGEERDAIASDHNRLYELVSEIVLPYFDFRRMSQWVLGKYWRVASPQQRDEFVAQFRRLLVRTYGKALSEYADEKIVYLPFSGSDEARTVTVRTEIEQPGNTIPISYSMYRSENGWMVYDVAISGVSLVTNYRSTFGSIIHDEGMDSLLRQLADKNNRGDDG